MHQGLLTLHFILLGLFILGGALETTKCREPSVRKEWRSLSREQRKHWIAAVTTLFTHTWVRYAFEDVLKLIVTLLLDLNHRSVIHLHSARYIGLGYSSLGIAGIFAYLRRHCAIAVGIGEFFRTGIGRKKFNLFPQFEQVFPVPGLVYDYTHPANASFIKLVVESLIEGFVGTSKVFRREWKE
ncbi:hypothetical protein B0H13DRAFT_1895604 [Mycena leptocephala]|nr:hypothetical protein B0H13DRAFT_1895604 [Mycena leptocephala]